MKKNEKEKEKELLELVVKLKEEVDYWKTRAKRQEVLLGKICEELEDDE